MQVRGGGSDGRVDRMADIVERLHLPKPEKPISAGHCNVHTVVFIEVTAANMGWIVDGIHSIFPTVWTRVCFDRVF